MFTFYQPAEALVYPDFDFTITIGRTSTPMPKFLSSLNGSFPYSMFKPEDRETVHASLRGSDCQSRLELGTSGSLFLANPPIRIGMSSCSDL